MAAANTLTGTNIETSVNFELRNTGQVQYTSAEVLQYINKWYEIIYKILAEHECDLVCTGSGSFSTVAGTERYSLTSNTMGDLWSIPGGFSKDYSRVRISGKDNLELVDMRERNSHLLLKDDGTSGYAQPTGYYLKGDYIGLIPFPDAAYTVYIEDYIPNFVGLTALTESMPFMGLFNDVIKQGLLITAKSRENYGSGVDAAIMEIVKDRAMSIVRQRQKQDVGSE